MADNTLLNSGVGGDTIRDIDRSGVKSQVVVLDAGGSAGESLVTLTNPMPVQPAASYFAAATGNTSSAQLAAGATFTGTIESTINQPAASILISSDQPILLTLNEYIDAAGTYLANTTSYSILANYGYSKSVTLNANYFRLSAKNLGGSPTTTLNINTYYGTIFPAGQTTSDHSVPVVMASDHAAVPVKANNRLPSQELNPQILEVLRLVLIEMRINNQLLNDGLLPGRANQNLDLLRNDEDFLLQLNG